MPTFSKKVRGRWGLNHNAVKRESTGVESLLTMRVIWRTLEKRVDLVSHHNCLIQIYLDSQTNAYLSITSIWLCQDFVCVFQFGCVLLLQKTHSFITHIFGTHLIVEDRFPEPKLAYWILKSSQSNYFIVLAHENTRIQWSWPDS